MSGETRHDWNKWRQHKWRFKDNGNTVISVLTHTCADPVRTLEQAARDRCLDYDARHALEFLIDPRHFRLYRWGAIVDLYTTLLCVDGKMGRPNELTRYFGAVFLSRDKMQQEYIRHKVNWWMNHMFEAESIELGNAAGA